MRTPAGHVTGRETSFKLALLTPQYDRRGGAESVVETGANALAQHGLQVSVFAGSTRESASPRGPFEFVDEALFAEARDIVAGPGHRARVRELANRLSSAQIVDMHRTAPVALLKALRSRVPTMLSLHSSEMTCPAGSRFLVRSGSVCERAPGPGCLIVDRREQCLTLAEGVPFTWKSRVRALWRSKLTRRATSLATMVVFNSADMKRLFEKHFGSLTMSRVIPPPLRELPPSTPSRQPGRIAIIGRLIEMKGFADALNALVRLTGAHLDVYGEGPQRAQLEKTSQQLGVHGRVTFHGWVGPDDLALALARASCLLVPTRGYEAWGMVGPEAIAQGCPVVAYDSGGIREWCLPRFGTLVPIGNVAALSLAAKDWLARMAAGFDTSSWHSEAHQRWGVPRYVEQYLEAAHAAMSAFSRGQARVLP